jgi:hypothetical protein
MSRCSPVAPQCGTNGGQIPRDPDLSGAGLRGTTSVAVVVLAVVLPFRPLGAWFGFVPPSAAFLLGRALDASASAAD